MSENSENFDAVFETMDVDAAIRTQGVRWSDTNVGRVRADHWSGEVQLRLAQGKETNTDVSVSADFDSDTARKMANLIRDNRENTWETDSCTMRLDRGWLYYEDLGRDQAEHRATVSFLNDGDYVEMMCVYKGSDEGDKVHIRTQLSDSEQEKLVTALEIAAKEADEYDPIETSSSNVKSNSRLRNFLRTAIPAGITLSIGYGVISVLHSRLKNIDLIINGEPVNFVLAPENFVIVLAIIIFIVWAIHYLPGRAGGGLRG